MALVDRFYRKTILLAKFITTLTLVCLTACGSLDNSDLPEDADNKELKDSKKVSEIYIADANLKNCIMDSIEKDDIQYIFEVQNLNCNIAGISDLTGLENFTALNTLKLYKNNIQNITALKNLTKLKYLYLHENYLISDLSPIANLTSLEVLYIDDNAVETLEPLRNITNLTYLGAGNNIGLDNLEPLVGMIKLEYLALGGSVSISNTDISVLKNLTSLLYLYLDNNNISDISSLSGMEGLRFLTLDNNFITEACHLKDLKNLYGLHLRNNKISAVICLSSLKNIEDEDGKRLVLLDNSDISCDEADDLEEALEENINIEKKVIKPLPCKKNNW